jgi:hypothetical protein
MNLHFMCMLNFNKEILQPHRMEKSFLILVKIES